MPKAVLLLSGGLDSTTLLARRAARRIRRARDDVSLRPASRDRDRGGAASRGARSACSDHVDRRHRPPHLRRIRADERLDRRPAGPRRRASAAFPSPTCRRATRSFSSFALAWAEVLGAADIFIGVNALDYSGYPDCRPEYIEAFERMANLATRGGVEGTNLILRIRTPLIDLTKAQIIRLGLVARRRLRDHAELLRSRCDRGRVRSLRRLPVAAERVRRGRTPDPAPLRVDPTAPPIRAVRTVYSAAVQPPDVHRQRDLLHASGRRRERRQAGGVLSFLGVQSVDGTRGGSRDGDLRLLRHRLRRRRTGRRQVRDGRRARRRGGRAVAGRTRRKPVRRLHRRRAAAPARRGGHRRAARSRIRGRRRDERHRRSRRAGSTGSA